MGRPGQGDSEVIDLAPIEGNEIPGDVSEQWEEFERFRDEAEGVDKGMTVWVYRIPTDARNNPIAQVDTRLLFTTPIDAVDSLPGLFTRIKKEFMPRGYGVGMFRIMIRQNQARGVKWQKTYTLEKGALDDDPIPAADPSAPKSDPAMAIVAAAMDRQTAMIERLMNERGNVQGPARDPFAETERMVTMVTGLAGILVNRPAGAVVASGSLSEQVSGLKELLSLSRQLNPDGGGIEPEEGMVGILKTLSPFAELLKTMIEKAPAQPAIVRQPRLAGPGPRRAPPAGAGGTGGPGPIHGAGGPVNAPGRAKTAGVHVPPNQPLQPQGDRAMLLKVTEITNDLITLHTTQGADGATLGAALVPMIPEEIEGRLLDLLESENWFEKLCAFNAKVHEHREFFEAVRKSVLAEYESDDGTENVEPAEILPESTA